MGGLGSKRIATKFIIQHEYWRHYFVLESRLETRPSAVTLDPAHFSFMLREFALRRIPPQCGVESPKSLAVRLAAADRAPRDSSPGFSGRAFTNSPRLSLPVRAT
jgi:hypothetical protein